MSPRVEIQMQSTKKNGHKLETKNVRQVADEDIDIDSGYYIHDKKLGEGGFGTVRLGTHLKTRQKVAIKKMNKVALGADLFRAHIEINALKALQHENIAKLLQVIETKEDIYLVLEYCSGGELFDYLVSKQRLLEYETKTIMRDLANVLAFIHDNGFAHRDLKPENLLFDENHKIKLIDFGLAASCRDFNTSLSHLKTCCGSPAYAAPELLQGDSYSGSAVDVWSAGVLLYALLVGKLPFDSDNVGVLYKKIQAGIYWTPQWLSEEVRDLIKKMLNTNPIERITIKDMLSHPWLRVIDVQQQDNNPRTRRPSFDEILWSCHELFPETSINELKQNILTGFGYQTATYWLLKKNPDIIQGPTLCSHVPVEDKSIETPCDRRRSKSFDTSIEIDNGPKVIGAKRKIVECEALKGYQVKTKVNEDVSSPNRPNRELLANSPSRIPILKKPAKLTPKAVDSTKLATPKHSNGTPIVPNKKPRVLGALNASVERNNNKSPLSSIVKSFTPKTPIECTPKKSLFKRILETATPSKSQSPRILSASTDPKNITLTKFTDPQLCIDRLVEVLKARGIQCKQKSFVLRCVLSTKNVIMLSFNLEVCKFANRCVIQRKRLKGDAWNYKRVCEEILRISNE